MSLIHAGVQSFRPGASKQGGFNVNEFEMRHLLREIELDVSITPEPIDAEREA
jgi:hypothetical protein